jgi:methanogenic corrinoid protein MtbC1
MALALRVRELFRFDRFSPRALENHFIVPEIARRDDVDQRRAKLAAVVADDIIPHLLKLHSVAPIEEIMPPTGPTRADVEELAHIVLGPDVDASAAYVAVLRERGVPMDTVFTDLLEPTARLLGEMWQRDECDFIDVTLGTARLQKLLAIFNASHDRPPVTERRQVLMATTPGEQHSFGVRMVEEVLVSSRWNVDTDYEATLESLAAAVDEQWYAVVGLTLVNGSGIDRTRDAIATIRQHSCNRAVGIMVGGPPFTENPLLAEQIGADATAVNATSAALVAQKLFDRGTLNNWEQVAA